MTIIVIGFLLLLREQEPLRIDRIIEQLNDDAPEIRERAQQELLRLGPKAYSLLRRSAENANPEQRARIAAILSSAEFATVAEIISANIKKLSDKEEDVWEAGVKGLIYAGKIAIPELNKLDSEAENVQKFRAEQVSEILRRLTGKGLIFGIVVGKPSTALGRKVSGLEVIVNLGDHSVTLPSIDAEVEVRKAMAVFLPGKESAQRKPSCKTLQPGEVYVRRRSDFLLRTLGDDIQGYVIPSPGSWRLLPRFSYPTDHFGLGCWTGELEGNVVSIDVER